MSNKVPQIRFNGYSDAWEEHKLGEMLINLEAGVSVNSSDYETGYFILKTSAIKQGTVDSFEVKSVVQEEVCKAKTPLIKNSIIISRMNTPELVGASGLVRESIDNIFLPDRLWQGQVAENFSSEWLIQSINIASNIQKIRNLATGTSGSMKNISKKSILDLIINVPKLKEQKQIGSFLKQLDNTIALHQRKLDLLKEQKKGYLQKMFPKNGKKVPELRFAGFADDWEERKLSNYITITGGNAWKSSDYSIGGDYLVVTIANVQGQRNINDKIGNKISVADPGKYLLKREDILVSLTGNVGRVSRMTDIPAVLNQRVGLVKPKTKKIDDEFLFQVLSNRRFESSMVASGQGAAQANISNNDVLSYELLVPQDVREQSIIAHFFRKFDNAIALHQRKLDLLKEQKKGFLQNMFV
ncbi:restriction endonuclease subunit S [Weissella paramesenteroides]|uniref:restriction endonuclease subunit S n=1 Tax=Weissella paramesenteroides TaxID=1249 RepID=UPI003F263A0F